MTIWLYALCWGFLFAAVMSGADSFSERIAHAWFGKSRKQFTGAKEKWAYVLRPRSVCDFCQKPVKPWALIPVFGFLLSRGRCVYCRKPVYVKYILQESAALLYGTFIAYLNPHPVFLLFSVCYFFIAVFIAKIDAGFLLIPLEAVFVFLVLGFLEFIVLPKMIFLPYAGFGSTHWIILSWATLWGALFGLMHLLRPQALGRADIYLVFALCMGAGTKGLFLPTIAAALGLLSYAFIALYNYLPSMRQNTIVKMNEKKPATKSRENRHAYKFSLTAFSEAGSIWKLKTPFGLFLGASFLILRLLAFWKL